MIVIIFALIVRIIKGTPPKITTVECKWWWSLTINKMIIGDEYGPSPYLLYFWKCFLWWHLGFGDVDCHHLCINSEVHCSYSSSSSSILSTILSFLQSALDGRRDSSNASTASSVSSTSSGPWQFHHHHFQIIALGLTLLLRTRSFYLYPCIYFFLRPALLL